MNKQLCLCLCLATTITSIFAQPPAKHWEAIAWDENTGTLAVFSGAEFVNNAMQVTDSLWLFNGSWRLIDDNSISGRWAHDLVYHNNSLFTYGGLAMNAQNQETVLNDLYQFTNTWTKITEGPRLALPALHSSNGKLLLAGQLYDQLSKFEVWELNGNKFNKIHSFDLGAEADGLRTMFVKGQWVVAIPSDTALILKNLNSNRIDRIKELSGLTKFAITYHPQLDSYFIFGGIGPGEKFRNEFWQIRNGFARLINSTDKPPQKASCNLIPAANDLILYGGVEQGAGITNSMWKYENGNWNRVEY